MCMYSPPRLLLTHFCTRNGTWLGSYTNQAVTLKGGESHYSLWNGKKIIKIEISSDTTEANYLSKCVCHMTSMKIHLFLFLVGTQGLLETLTNSSTKSKQHASHWALLRQKYASKVTPPRADPPPVSVKSHIQCAASALVEKCGLKVAATSFK